MQSPTELNIPIDKVPVGLLASKFIEISLDMMRDGKIKEYIAVIQHFDDFLTDYKSRDKEYEKQMSELEDKKRKKLISNSFEESRAVFRILMSLLHRNGFLPVKTYEGDLVVDIEIEKDLKETDEEDL